MLWGPYVALRGGAARIGASTSQEGERGTARMWSIGGGGGLHAHEANTSHRGGGGLHAHERHIKGGQACMLLRPPGFWAYDIL